MNDSLDAFLSTSIRLSTPLIYAALGGYFSERCGIVNIALEGLMLIGAFVAAITVHYTHQPFLGLSLGILASIIFAILHAVLTIEIKSDQIISGLSINFLAAGLIPVLCKALFDSSNSTPMLQMSERIPHLLFSLSTLTILSFILVAFVYIFHQHSRFGQYLRFSGEFPEALTTQGISIKKTRWMGLILSGIFCGLAGAYLSIDHGSGFTRNMTAGRGFIALAALILGRWHPFGALIAALLLGAIEASQILLQGILLPNQKPIPVQWIQMIPYITAIIILGGFFGKRMNNSGMPKSLGRILSFILITLLPLGLLTSCKQSDSPSLKKNEPVKSDESSKNREVNAEFIKELYAVVLNQKNSIDEDRFLKLMNILDQGGHYEGLYNGLIYSKSYSLLEKGIAPVPLVKLYAEIMAYLSNDSNQERNLAIPSLTKDALEFSSYTLKKRLGEKTLSILEINKAYREKLATWYSKFAAYTTSKGVDFGIEARNKTDEYSHYKWALNADLDRITWECLNRVHRLLNSKSNEY